MRPATRMEVAIFTIWCLRFTIREMQKEMAEQREIATRLAAKLRRMENGAV